MSIRVARPVPQLAANEMDPTVAGWRIDSTASLKCSFFRHFFLSVQ